VQADRSDRIFGAKSLANQQLLVPVVERLGHTATLAPIQDADHSFHVPARSGRTDSQVLAEVLDTLATWVEPVARHNVG